MRKMKQKKYEPVYLSNDIEGIIRLSTSATQQAEFILDPLIRGEIKTWLLRVTEMALMAFKRMPGNYYPTTILKGRYDDLEGQMIIPECESPKSIGPLAQK